MRWRFTKACLGVAAVVTGALGCNNSKGPLFIEPGDVKRFKCNALDIDYPDVKTCSKPEAVLVSKPRTINSEIPTNYRDMTLQEAVQVALQNSQAMRDLGGRLLSSPATVSTIYEPAIKETDGRFGVEAALSAFDATIQGSMFWAKNDRPVNNLQAGSQPRLLSEDTGNSSLALTKRAATGTQYTMRQLHNYDYSNAPGNLFPSVWDVQYEAEVRHPLLQGGGVEFNRIAGPFATPGFLGTSGVLVSRINTDIALVDFEIGVRNMVSDVENAYWELYFAYRDLQAKIKGRDASLQTWRKVQANAIAKRAGGEEDKESQAREQYFLFEGQVQNALAGTPGRGTLSGNGSTGGVFQGSGGVYASERRLRFLLGLPATDDSLLRPSEEPTTAEVKGEWDGMLTEALTRREELRRQKWTTKRRELELIAARNFLLPRLDLVGLYRWRGFGDDLGFADNTTNNFQDAYNSLTSGDFQEWQMGFQFSMTIGFRQGWAAVRNAELLLTRERAVLRDQELQVSHDLAAAVAEVERAYALVKTNFNRRIAAARQAAVVEETYNQGTATLDLLLDAQRRQAEADVAYYRSLVEHTLALKNLQLEKGTLLAYNGVFLTEGPWPAKAYADAKELANRLVKQDIDYGVKKFAQPGVLSLGKFPQHPGAQIVDGGEVGPMEASPPEVPAQDGKGPDALEGGKPEGSAAPSQAQSELQLNEPTASAPAAIENPFRLERSAPAAQPSSAGIEAATYVAPAAVSAPAAAPLPSNRRISAMQQPAPLFGGDAPNAPSPDAELPQTAARPAPAPAPAVSARQERPARTIVPVSAETYGPAPLPE